MTSREAFRGQPQFSIGRALSDSFGVLSRNFKTMAVISVTVTLAESAIRYLLTGSVDDEENGSTILSLISYALVTAPVTYITFQDLRGHKPSLGETMSAGLQRLIRVVGTTLIVGITIVTPIVVVAIIVMTSAGSLIPLIVGGLSYALIIFVAWYVVVPVQVVEAVSFFGAFSRASALTRGRRWAVLGLALVFVALVFIVALVVAVVAELVAVANPMLSLFLLIPLSAFITVYGATVPTVTYCLLRSEKEGIGIEDIVKVFD